MPEHEPIMRAFRIVRVVREGDVGVTLVLDGALPAQPAQFAMVWLPGIDERPFSLVDDDPVTISIAHVGPFTERLCALQPGDRVWLRGPFGHGFAPHGARHLLLGGGSGTAGLALLAKRLTAREGHEVVSIVGARTAGALMLRWRYEELGCSVIAATDDGSQGVRGTVLSAAQPLLANSWPDAIYACGPEPFLRALAQQSRALGIPCWVSLERVMRCGIGVCGSCHCGDRLVCRDGPVFAATDLC